MLNDSEQYFKSGLISVCQQSQGNYISLCKHIFSKNQTMTNRLSPKTERMVEMVLWCPNDCVCVCVWWRVWVRGFVGMWVCVRVDVCACLSDCLYYQAQLIKSLIKEAYVRDLYKQRFSSQLTIDNFWIDRLVLKWLIQNEKLEKNHWGRW